MTVEGHDYRIAFVMDPDGYKIEFVERGTMKVGDLIQYQDDAPYPLRYTYRP